MKLFLLLASSVSILISVHGQKEVALSYDNINFYDRFSAVIEENSKRYDKLVMELQHLNYSQTDATKFMAKLIVGLQSGRDKIAQVEEKVLGVCTCNQQTYESYLRLPNNKAYLPERVNSLSDMIKYSSNSTSVAKLETRMLKKYLERNLTALVKFLDDLKILADDEIRTLRVDMVKNYNESKELNQKCWHVGKKSSIKRVQSAQNELVLKVHKDERFLVELRSYKQWVRQVKRDLKKSFDRFDQNFSNLEIIMERDQKVIADADEVDSSPSKEAEGDDDDDDIGKIPKTQKQKQEIISKTRNYVFTELDKAVYGISNSSQSFLDSTNLNIFGTNYLDKYQAERRKRNAKQVTYVVSMHIKVYRSW